eukprot:COSAG02_NODE_1715_length_11211_cov_8.483801_13_plen_68_part_00
MAEESNQLQTELKAKIGEVRDARSASCTVCHIGLCSLRALAMMLLLLPSPPYDLHSFGRCWTNTNPI